MCVTVIDASGRVLHGWTSALLKDPWTVACEQVDRKRAGRGGGANERRLGSGESAELYGCCQPHGEAAGLLLCGVALKPAASCLRVGAHRHRSVHERGAAPFTFHSQHVQNLPSHTRWWAASPLRLASPKADRSVDLSLRVGQTACSFLSFCFVAWMTGGA